MDSTRFTDKKTGELVRIALKEDSDWAFVPAPLPPRWDFPTELWPLLAEAREQLARLDEKGQTVPNPTLLLDPLQKREAIRSSSLEGTYATAEELLLFELGDPERLATKTDGARREVWNYDQALRYGVRNLNDPKGLPLSKRLITDMHGLLMKGVRGGDVEAGSFRTVQVHIGSDRRYVPPPPGDVLIQSINDLESFLANHQNAYDPLVLSYLVHYQFEAIHPFRDGNGRIGRLLLALTTFQWSDLYLPWLYMSAYFERYKDEYVENMFRVSTHGDWARWIEFCLRGTVEQCNDAIRRCNALNQLRAEMRSKLEAMPRMGPLIDAMFINPIFTASEVAKWGDTSMPTARRDIEELEKAGYAQHLSGKRPRHYFIPRIFAAAYSEPGANDGQPTSESADPESSVAPQS